MRALARLIVAAAFVVGSGCFTTFGDFRTCGSDADCGDGRCLKTSSGADCVSRNAGCGAGCPAGTVCVDDACRTSCVATMPLSCLVGQACIGSACLGCDPAHDPQAAMCAAAGGAHGGGASGASGTAGGGASGAAGTGGSSAGAAGATAGGAPAGGGGAGGTAGAAAGGATSGSGGTTAGGAGTAGSGGAAGAGGSGVAGTGQSGATSAGAGGSAGSAPLPTGSACIPGISTCATGDCDTHDNQCTQSCITSADCGMGNVCVQLVDGSGKATITKCRRACTSDTSCSDVAKPCAGFHDVGGSTKIVLACGSVGAQSFGQAASTAGMAPWNPYCLSGFGVATTSGTFQVCSHLCGSIADCGSALPKCSSFMYPGSGGTQTFMLCSD